LLKAGLDPSAGILHMDDPDRYSFVLDVMDAVRSEVDFWLLEFIQKNKLPKKYFTVMPGGNIRLSLLLTPKFIETIPLLEEKVVPVVEKIKRMTKKEKQK
jgi:CRISPR/Cas system-associated endonuclease Cas1